MILTCLACGTVREPGVPCSQCAAAAPPGVPAPPKVKQPMALAVCFGIATVGTLIHWAILLSLAFSGAVVAHFFDGNRDAAGVNSPGVNKFILSMLLGGVVATWIGWFMAYKRHPFVGAVAGVSAGMGVTVVCWLIAL